MTYLFVKDGDGPPGQSGPPGAAARAGAAGSRGTDAVPTFSSDAAFARFADPEWIVELLRLAEDDYATENIESARHTLEFIVLATSDS